MKEIALGSQGLKVTELGYGCMGLTSFYGHKLPDDEVVGMLKKVFDRGVRFWDTANAYVYSDFWRLLQLQSPVVCQEEIIGKVLQEVGRENVVLATKTGIRMKVFPKPTMELDSTPEFVRQQCEDSLRRLGTTYLDIFYLHRISPTTPIEVTMATLRDLVDEGKIRYIGLSECSAKTIRRAHKVHPVTCVQMEWSLWCRGIEKEIIPTCAELGIGVVAYSPLGRGFFGGEFRKGENNFEKGDFRNTQDRLTGENLEKNLEILEKVKAIAEERNATPAQLALAWLKHKQELVSGAGVVAIPGTTKEKNLISNVESVDIMLTPADMEALEKAAETDAVGTRYTMSFENAAWEDEHNPELPPEEAAKYYRN